MSQKKTLQELTFKDNFMFGAVLLDPENCKGVIERSIGTEIERVEVSKELPELEMGDGAHTIFLSTKGTNENEVPEELVNFLKFVGAKPSETENDYEDAFVKRLQNSVREVKASREMGARYMTFQELLKDEREAGRKEGEDKLSKLISLLLVEGLADIVELVVNDEKARLEYYKKYNIN